MKKREKVLPVSLTHLNPLYIDGRIKYWTVRVFFKGDLSTNTKQRNEWRELIDKHPYEEWYIPVSPFQPVLKPNIIIPNESRLSGLFIYHQDQDVSELEYCWRDGLFGCGAKHAWDFRIKMFSQIINNRNK